MYRNILVTLDGTPFAEHALPPAAFLARRAGATLHVAEVFVPEQGEATAGADYRVRDTEVAYLGSVTRRLKDATGLAAVGHMLDGSIADALERHITDIGADLVVLATHARGTLAKLWFGSLAEELMRRLAVPLLLVRPTPSAPPDLRAAGALHRVLIPLDGSSFSESILKHALRLVEALSARCELLRVVEPIPSSTIDGAGMVVAVDDTLVLAEIKAGAEAHLERIAAPLRERGLSVVTRTVVHPSPTTAIADLAHADHCDVIALATHARHGLAKLFLGNSADDLVRGVGPAVLVFHPSEGT